MKKLSILVLTGVMVAVLTAGTARASTSLREGAIGFSVGIGSDTYELSGRYFVYDALAVIGGLGFSFQGGDRDETDFGLFAGVRKYLSESDLAFFFGGQAGYASHGEDGTDNDGSLFRAEVNGGAEYFFDEQFSIEGTVGAGLQFGKLAKDDVYSLGTFTRSLAATFYF